MDLQKLVKTYTNYPCIEDTVLTGKAIEINDDLLTTPQEKIKKLKSLFSKWHYKIKVINQPEEVNIES